MKPLLTTAALLISIVTAGCDVSCNIVSETPVPGPSELSTRSIAINFTLDKKEVTSMEVVHLLHDGREIARSSQYKHLGWLCVDPNQPEIPAKNP